MKPAKQFDEMWNRGTFRRIIDVDFNNMRDDGRVIATQSEFAPLWIGEKVIARDEAENMRFDSEVTGISEDGRRLYLTMQPKSHERPR